MACIPRGGPGEKRGGLGGRSRFECAAWPGIRRRRYPIFLRRFRFVRAGRLRRVLVRILGRMGMGMRFFVAAVVVSVPVALLHCAGRLRQRSRRGEQHAQAEQRGEKPVCPQRRKHETEGSETGGVRACPQPVKRRNRKWFPGIWGPLRKKSTRTTRFRPISRGCVVLSYPSAGNCNLWASGKNLVINSLYSA